MTRSGSTAQTGVEFLDGPGVDAATVRLSRAVGTPAGLPDVHGIAVRMEAGGHPADLLFATTGLGRIGRFVLTLTTSQEGRPYTTLLPSHGPRGPVVLGAVPDGPTSFTLVHATGIGEWAEFGVLSLTDPYDGPGLSFDPVQNPVEGLPPYAWVRRLREPAYRTARRNRPCDPLHETTASLEVA